MRQITFIFLALASTSLVVPDFVALAVAAETETLWVAHRRVDCVGVAPQKCYLIKNTQYEDWRFWYGEIEGFDFEEGFAYEIRVREIEVEDPPADASAIRLELVEVLLKVETHESSVPEPPAPPIAPTSPITSEDLPLEPEVPKPVVQTPAPPKPKPVEPVESSAPPADPEPPATSLPAKKATPPAPTPAPAPATGPEPAPTPLPAKKATPPAAAPAPAPVAKAGGPGQLYRGHLTIGAGVEARSFKLCGAEESLWVEDRTDADLWGLYRRLSSYPNRPVFMQVTAELADAPAGGFGAHFGQQLLIRQVLNATVESAGCFSEPESYAFKATGNEPFWNVEITRRGLVFSELGREDSIVFPYSPPTFFIEQVIYRSQTRAKEPRTLIVRLVEETCNDSMADATFSFTATVKIDDRELVGCAREGEEEP